MSRINKSVSRKRAFTLVELLVVIGTIAVLIAILLPTLNRARQNANNVRCLSNLRQMGTAIEMYVNAHQGTLPSGLWLSNKPAHAGKIAGGGAFLFPAPVDRETGWGALLLYAMGKGEGVFGDEAGSMMRQLFVDTDTIPDPGKVQANHYISHPLLMPEVMRQWPAGHPLHPDRRKPYKKARIRRAAEIVLIMDGTQIIEFWGVAGDTHPVGFNLDNNRVISNSGGPKTWLLEDVAQSLGAVAWTDSIDGGPNFDAQKLEPQVPARAPGNIRWRHMNNTTANFLFVDGHAESRRYFGQFNTELKRFNIHVPRP